MSKINDFQDATDAYERKDYKTAYKLILPLAEQGDARAQTALGLMYAEGLGFPQDYKEAVKWYRLAVEQGYVAAQYNLGVMYDNGRGVPQDDKEAIKLYRLSAEQGDADAQHNLELLLKKVNSSNADTDDFQDATDAYYNENDKLMNTLLKFLEGGGEKPYRKLVEYHLRRTPSIGDIMLAVSGEWQMQPEKISKEKQVEFIDSCNNEFAHDASFWSKESCRSAFGKIMLIAVPELDLQDWITDPGDFWVSFEQGEVDTNYIKEEKQEASFGLFQIVTQNFTYSAYQNKKIREFMGIRKSFFSR